jgi:hypothetical protein
MELISIYSLTNNPATIPLYSSIFLTVIDSIKDIF